MPAPTRRTVSVADDTLSVGLGLQPDPELAWVLLFYRVGLVGYNNLIFCQLLYTRFIACLGFPSRGQNGMRQKGKARSNQA